MYPDRKKFVLEPFMLVPVIFGKVTSYTQKVLSIAPASLIGYWPMNETAGVVADNAEGTAARDGSYTGATLGQTGIGDGNTCPLFDGVNDYMQFYSASLSTAGISDTMTIACWAKVANVGVWTDGLGSYIMQFCYGAATDVVYLYKSNGLNKLTFSCEWGNGGPLYVNKFSMTETGWMHFAITMDVAADEMKAYYNGVQEGATQSGLLTQSDNTLDATRNCVATNTITPSGVFPGYAAHAAIWTSVLTPAQILELATV